LLGIPGGGSEILEVTEGEKPRESRKRRKKKKKPGGRDPPKKVRKGTGRKGKSTTGFTIWEKDVDLQGLKGSEER